MFDHFEEIQDSWHAVPFIGHEVPKVYGPTIL